MKRVAGAVSLLLLAAFQGCETTSSTAPAVTPAMAGKTNSVQQLTEGRQLFVSRCIDCHSLPPIAKYSAQQWPALVDKMSGRAHLKPNQRDAVVAYLLAAKFTKD